MIIIINVKNIPSSFSKILNDENEYSTQTGKDAKKRVALRFYNEISLKNFLAILNSESPSYFLDDNYTMLYLVRNIKNFITFNDLSRCEVFKNKIIDEKSHLDFKEILSIINKVIEVCITFDGNIANDLKNSLLNDFKKGISIVKKGKNFLFNIIRRYIMNRVELHVKELVDYYDIQEDYESMNFKENSFLDNSQCANLEHLLNQHKSIKYFLRLINHLKPKHDLTETKIIRHFSLLDVEETIIFYLQKLDSIENGYFLASDLNKTPQELTQFFVDCGLIKQISYSDKISSTLNRSLNLSNDPKKMLEYIRNHQNELNLICRTGLGISFYDTSVACDTIFPSLLKKIDVNEKICLATIETENNIMSVWKKAGTQCFLGMIRMQQTEFYKIFKSIN